MTARIKTPILAFAACLFAGASYPAGEAGRGREPGKADDKAIIHVLNRIGFGPSPAAIERVRDIGVRAYIDEQMRPERIPDTAMAARLERFATLTKSSRDLADQYFVPALEARRQRQRQAAETSTARPDAPAASVPASPPERTETMRMQRAPIAELSEHRLLRAAYSERQLEEVLVDFWFNHFNVFVGKGQVRLYLTEYERDAIRPHVLGKFRDLLGATAASPAMLFYLDNWQSTAAPDARTTADRQMSTRRRPQLRRFPPNRTPADAPQARPLRRRGLNENYARELMELHTLGVDGGYTQKDVQEVARAFTGWTIAGPRLGGPFRFDPALHDDGEKVVLGQRIRAGGGQQDGEQVLDLLSQHPSTARFIATKLARRFVSDDPPAALVSRAAERFRQTDGDIREVVRTIITSPEFFADAAYRAKVKNPLEFVVSAVRASALDAASGLPLVQALRDLGMPLYGAQPPTGYADRADDWVNTGSLLNRMNFAVALANGRLRLDRASPGPGRASVRAPEDAPRRLLATALAGDVSETTASTIARATTTAQAVALILGSPEFQKR
jgi:uncharacterized protein (DUF1800 family)